MAEMTDTSSKRERDAREQFLAEAKQSRSNLLAEIWSFMKQNKKWWLLPIILIFIVFGGLMLLGGTSAAPFIYTLY